MNEKLELDLEKARLIDELMFIETQIDTLWQFNPDNPEAVDVKKRVSEMICLKEEVEEKLESLNTSIDG